MQYFPSSPLQIVSNNLVELMNLKSLNLKVFKEQYHYNIRGKSLFYSAVIIFVHLNFFFGIKRKKESIGIMFYFYLYKNNPWHPGLYIYILANNMRQMKKNNTWKLVEINSSSLLLKYIGWSIPVYVVVKRGLNLKVRSVFVVLSHPLVFV